MQLTSSLYFTIIELPSHLQIVFSEARWVGSKEENPEEKALPMPPSLTEQRHEKFDFNASRGDEAGWLACSHLLELAVTVVMLSAAIRRPLRTYSKPPCRC